MSKKTVQNIQHLDADYLRKIFNYDAKTGYLSWAEPKRSRWPGPIGVKAKTPYIQVGIDYKIYLAHRIIFIMHHGYNPQEIDHIDGDKRNNRIENLREVTRSENTINRKKVIRNNTSGHTGVTFHKATKKWMAYIRKNKQEVKRICRNKEEAIELRKEMVKKHYSCI